MPDLVSFEIKGLSELQKKLEEMATKDTRLAVRIALNAGASEVKKAAQEEAPVEAEGENSGFLKDHINIKVRMQGPIVGTAFIGPSTAAYPNRSQKPHQVSFINRAGKRISFTATKITAATVGRFLEYGTSKMAAHPWLTRAWNKSKEAALAHIIAKLREQLKLS
jgi:HK97 gp10 family phage protein